MADWRRDEAGQTILPMDEGPGPAGVPAVHWLALSLIAIALLLLWPFHLGSGVGGWLSGGPNTYFAVLLGGLTEGLVFGVLLAYAWELVTRRTTHAEQGQSQEAWQDLPRWGSP